MQIALLLTGNEIMSGDTVDSNSAMIAQSLGPAGFTIGRKVTLADDFDALRDEISALSRDWPVLIVNGGLGPTVDDLTASALAEAASVAVCEHQDAATHVTQWCQRRGFEANAANMKQAQLPKGCSIVANPVGSAVGFSLTLNNCLIICTPGVPSELREMLGGEIKLLLQSSFTDVVACPPLRFKTFGIGESRLQQLVIDHLPNWPSEVELGFRAGAPLLEIKLAIADPVHEPLRAQCQQDLQQLIGNEIIGRDDCSLESIVVEQLKTQQLQLATAESCTGGQIAAAITSVAGASEVFQAGIVSYSNAIKSSLLGVSTQTLQTHGAVSQAVVLEMAQGALQAANANIAIAVSGVAGPGGGTAEKPVGTVWIAWGSHDTLHARQFHLPFGRKMFQTMVTAIGLDLVRRQLAGLPEDVAYYSQKRKPA